MIEHTENKLAKLDIISALQMKNTQEKDKKVNFNEFNSFQNEVEDIDDGWSDYSEEEDMVKSNDHQITKKNDTSSKMVAKVEV